MLNYLPNFLGGWKIGGPGKKFLTPFNGRKLPWVPGLGVFPKISWEEDLSFLN